jgi:hypothetical protein
VEEIDITSLGEFAIDWEADIILNEIPSYKG